MATTPSKPNPLHGPPAPDKPTEATAMKLNIHGQPPQPHMAELPSFPDADYGEVVNAELEAGRQALKVNEARANAEHEAGKRNVARHSQSKE